ncbi:MAG: serine hydrolase domain-containing protein [Balneolaceae bacterium]|nr:serine hydrolase domain-containing protein [Balneolaceae bacterium]
MPELFCVVTTLPVWAQDPFSGRVDPLLTAYGLREELFSRTVLVAADGQVFRSGYGIANPSIAFPQRGQYAYFKLQSLAKPFTSMLVLQLVERGTLSLKRSISMYLPEYPGEYGADVTLSQLLTPYLRQSPTTRIAAPRRDATSRIEVRPADFANTIAQRPLDFEPGTDFSYSNSNYYLLGVIVETVTRNVLQPCAGRADFEARGITKYRLLDPAE